MSAPLHASATRAEDLARTNETDATLGAQALRAVAVLRDPATIRTRCAAIAAHVAAGDSAHFRLDLAALPAVAERVAVLTRARFPDLSRIPYHSRWRHFEAGGFDRKGELDRAMPGADAATLARARIDLTLVSVLLDAGAGPGWRYAEQATGQVSARSEGLAVASFRAFLAGHFSSDPTEPLRVDATALAQVDEALLARIFQVQENNPLVGLAGRAALLRGLGEALVAQPAIFGPLGRPGLLFDHLAAQGAISAAGLLGSLLHAFSAIWPSGQWLAPSGAATTARATMAATASAPGALPLGDVWPHPAAGGEGLSAGRVPFHKLSQWLSYSLLEPFAWAGVPVSGLEALTGLPEYRNGGLLLDAGVIVPRDARFAAQPRRPDEPWVIEWRALTVNLLDALAPLVRERLGVSASQLPLACILEGGTWAAGRQIAAELRPGGAPPVQIDSDGTVF